MRNAEFGLRNSRRGPIRTARVREVLLIPQSEFRIPQSNHA